MGLNIKDCVLYSDQIIC